MEAIRIREGKAQITESRCIDCGECIRYCPNRAKTAITDSLAELANYEYNIALPAPTLYAQFDVNISIDDILSGLLSLGFDEVFEVAWGAEFVTAAIRECLKQERVKKPLISSACPAVVRLIQVNFPELIDHLIPFEAPVEVAADMVRSHCDREVELPADKIGIWFITPCPAKMTAIRQPLGFEKSNITGAIGISQIYGDLLKILHNSPKPEKTYRRASWLGIGWAVAGGETAGVEVPNTLIVHDIHSVSNVLEQVALGKLKNIDYIETLACAGGCIGGPLTVENRFVAEHRMRQRIRELKRRDLQNDGQRTEGTETALNVTQRGVIEPRPVMRLDEDIFKAMHKVELMEKTLERLPGLDCGSCGSPTCKALAEDIVQGRASEMDCVFKLRERVHELAKEMMGLAEKLPPSLDKGQEQKEEDEDDDDRRND
jgi:iron only hydrogenase large subunit-like protein